MPAGASSTALARVAVITQPLLALYQASRGRGLTPAVLAMFSTTPRMPFGAGRIGLHARHDLAHRQVDRLHVDRDDAVEIGLADLLERLRQVRHAGVVDHDVDAAEVQLGGLHHQPHVGGIGDIDPHRARRRAAGGGDVERAPPG